jgi:hypothetical protein
VTDQDLKHFNVYAYADVNLPKNATATLGLSFDSLSGDPDVDKDQVNPKFGITWTPFAGTTLRAAVFRVLRRTLITDQTLEPTQVAGFIQFFDDFDLTEAWRYGGAIDQKFTSSLFGGVEFSKRDLTVPNLLDLSDPPNPVILDADWKEYLGRAYLYWTPYRWLALRAQYIFERFERDLIGPTELDTQRVPLGIGFFHPSGLSASLTATYWNQDGTFTPFLDPTFPFGPAATSSGPSMRRSRTVCRSGMVSSRLERRICSTRSSISLRSTLTTRRSSRSGRSSRGSRWRSHRDREVLYVERRCWSHWC